MSIFDNLAGYWNLTEASGTRVDSSGNGNDLADVNTVTGTTGPGSHNASFFVAANREILTHANAASINCNNTAFTVAIWVKFTSFVDFMGVAAHGLSGGLLAWEMHLNTTAAPQLTFEVYSDGTNGGGPQETTFGNISTGVWYLWIATVTVGGLIGVSVNGGAENTEQRTTPFNTTSTFGVGFRQNLDSSNSFDGALFGFGLWKRVLTAGERTFLYNSGNGRTYAELTQSFSKRFAVQSKMVQRRSINMAV